MRFRKIDVESKPIAYDGGSAAASMTSSTSFVCSDSPPWRGDLGRAIRPEFCVSRSSVDSWRKVAESALHGSVADYASDMLTCSCRLEDTKRRDELHERINPVWLGAEFDNAVVCRNIEDLAAELVCQVGDCLQMLVLHAQCLGGCEVPWVEVNVLCPTVRYSSKVSQSQLECTRRLLHIP